jgi:iron(III) transport system ATP-binding protein
LRQAGRDISRLPPAERDYGIVFQSYALFPNLSVADNVAYGLVNRKVARRAIAARVDELLKLVGLPGTHSKFPAQLSGGQQQRIALARALATSPGLLLLDEPLSALDALERLRLRQEIRSLQRELGVTTIMVTHDQEEALAMADRIVVMNHGIIEQIGTPTEIYRHPSTLFVAEFIGTMNRFEGRVVDGGVEHGGTHLSLEAAQGRPHGQRVLVLVRPETVEVSAANGNGAAPNTLVGDVVTQTFLGPVTRLKIIGTGVDVIADVPTQKALALPVGTRVAAALPAQGVRLLELTEDLPEIAEEPVPAGR